MPLIIRSRRPSEIQEFVRRNRPDLLQGKAGDSLKAYQAANGGSGMTFHDLEKSWLSAQGYTNIGTYLFALGFIVGVIRERIRNYLTTFTASVGSSGLLLEGATSFLLLEDGSKLLLES